MTDLSVLSMIWCLENGEKKVRAFKAVFIRALSHGYFGQHDRGWCCRNYRLSDSGKIRTMEGNFKFMIKGFLMSALLGAAVAVSGCKTAGTYEEQEAVETGIVSGEGAGKTEVPAKEAGEEDEESPGLSGPLLVMLKSSGRAQMLGVLVRSQNGSLIVIDGGWEEDGDYLLENIKKYGSHVDAWLITHPHPDHAGALCYILQNKSSEITIDRIYGSFAALEWYQKASPEEAPFVDTFLHELSMLPPGTVHGSVGKGFETDMDGLRVTALNDRYELESDPVNNSSIVYLLETGKQRVLFLGDMGYEGGQRLIKEAEENLKADVVQMAHHGQNGVGKEVYKAIAPKVCLWPAPQWLWDNDMGDGEGTGPWKTLETRKWMEELGVEENYCIKDGDIVLELE